jgi:heme/copper-type cytochrome/quinol oxidase subunit 2
MKRKLGALLIVLFSCAQSFGQNVEMADVMRSNGKIYVVVAVAAVVMAGIIGYMVYMDMRIRQIENKNKPD